MMGIYTPNTMKSVQEKEREREREFQGQGVSLIHLTQSKGKRKAGGFGEAPCNPELWFKHLVHPRGEARG